MAAERGGHPLDDLAAKDGGRVVLAARFIRAIAFNPVNGTAGPARPTW